MDDKLIFESSLTEEEIEKNFENVDLFTEMMQGLEDALAFEQGEMRTGTVTHQRGVPVVDIAAERKALHMTQKNYATLLGISPRTVEAWESGRSTPSPMARRLIFLLGQDHSLIQKLQAIEEL